MCCFRNPTQPKPSLTQPKRHHCTQAEPQRAQVWQPVRTCPPLPDRTNAHPGRVRHPPACCTTTVHGHQHPPPLSTAIVTAAATRTATAPGIPRHIGPTTPSTTAAVLHRRRRLFTSGALQCGCFWINIHTRGKGWDRCCPPHDDGESCPGFSPDLGFFRVSAEHAPDSSLTWGSFVCQRDVS